MTSAAERLNGYSSTSCPISRLSLNHLIWALLACLPKVSYKFTYLAQPWTYIVPPREAGPVILAVRNFAGYLSSNDLSRSRPIINDFKPAWSRTLCPSYSSISGSKIDANDDIGRHLHIFNPHTRVVRGIIEGAAVISQPCSCIMSLATGLKQRLVYREIEAEGSANQLAALSTPGRSGSSR